MNTVGSRILARLTELGMSQSELARRVGITQPAVANLIKRGGRSSHLHSIARVLETTPDYLLCKTDVADIDGVSQHLTVDETQLLEKLRRLSDEDREIVMKLTKKLSTR